jgi:hypothetical protein
VNEQVKDKKRKIIVVNDTSGRVHSGSDAVMDSFNRCIEDHEVIYRHRVGDVFFDESVLVNADWMLVNGEGTMHHSQPPAMFIIDLLDKAQKAGVRTALLNTIFQKMDKSTFNVIKKTSCITVRDPWSRNELREIGVEPFLFIDMCVGATGKYIFEDDCARSGVYKSIAHRDALIEGFFFKSSTSNFIEKLPFPSLYLDGDFRAVVKKLRQVEIYITGQYHGVYAAGLAGTPFVAFSGNSHKVEALKDWSGLDIPICEKKRDFNQLFEYALRNTNIYMDFKEFLISEKRLTKSFVNEMIGSH